MKRARILLVDDEPEIRRLLSRHLGRLGYTVQEAADGEAAAALAKHETPDVVITDMAMPRLGGLGLLEALRSVDHDLPVIVLTGHGSFDNAIAAMRKGILFDYLHKPLEELSLLEVAVARALEVRELRAKAREADQVVAIRELAVTASDKILNPLNVISLSVERLAREGITTEAKAKAVSHIEAAVGTITKVVRQMRAVARYTPREVIPGLWEIDLDRAVVDELREKNHESLPPT
ncbi:acetoacetate metabolism regulatory protein AtoC [Candidatus Methylomirabilis lanthanidiphila]|uniref:Acetoacetate metabolism regulatory protein AtoC n=1 Tax=Candidatus Methylomirabilis lanthanidiphila TaxID=2211376 RepID=A0A564ZJ97_9BACT|nr:response regulator [Candidatus Methylomirabilis lanthanidiphila]VUZ85176.1 acetoacetate metabolism regulatory protein AtoC [Candidatus Methylomirabilis lanthanidiphila]